MSSRELWRPEWVEIVAINLQEGTRAFGLACPGSAT